ncbi:hypothetical protein ACFQX7_03425 [Luedemannella flava]
MAVRLLADIPRLDVVVDIVAGLQGNPATSPVSPIVRLAVQVLRAAITYESYLKQGVATDSILSVLSGDDFDPGIVDALRTVRNGSAADAAVRAYRVSDMVVGMRIAEDVLGVNGPVLIGHGMLVTEMLLARLTNFARMGQLVEPILVTLPGGAR